MSPDKRQHRGAHPADERLFAPDNIPVLRQATSEMSWLLSRGYAHDASLKLVGDRYCLTHRQRLSVSRASCADARAEGRASTRRAPAGVRGERLVVDGFNLLITVEAALGGGVLIFCRDGCIRDLASVHGSYRSVLETEKAIRLVGEALEAFAPAAVEWLLDKPVSNSGRLAGRIADMARGRGWAWTVKTVFNPDAEILAAGAVAVTSDAIILDKASGWLNLSEHLITQHVPRAWTVDLRA